MPNSSVRFHFHDTVVGQTVNPPKYSISMVSPANAANT